MKKLISVFVVVLMLATIFVSAIPTSAASTNFTMSGNLKDPSTGDAYITLTFKISSNPGIEKVAFVLNYNAGVLQYDSYTNGAVFSDTDTVNVTDNNGKLTVALIAGAPTTATGNVVRVKFNIIDEFGTFDLSADVDKTATVLSDGSTPSLTSSFNSNTQHNYLALPTTIPATCTEDGYTEKRCQICGTILDHVITEEALGHDWDIIDYKDPTCTEDGYVSCICLNCDEPGYEVLPAAHTPVEESLAPTETETGYTRTVCSACGEIIEETVIPALGNTEQKEDTPETAPETNPTEDVKPTNPATGDSLIAIISIIVAMAAIAVCLYLIGKKDIKLSELKLCEKIKQCFKKED